MPIFYQLNYCVHVELSPLPPHFIKSLLLYYSQNTLFSPVFSSLYILNHINVRSRLNIRYIRIYLKINYNIIYNRMRRRCV